MTTYTLTLNLDGFVWPYNYAEVVTSINQIEVSPDNTNINDFYESLCSAITAILDGGGSCVSSLNNDTITITITPNNTPPTDINGDLIAFRVQDNDGVFYSSAWIEQQTTLCPNCQDVAIPNCDAVEISLPLPDDDYTVTLYDNQSGVAYTQNVQWTSGTGTWNSTNTAGVFTPFSIFTLTVTDSEGSPVSWPVGPNEYTCARVTFSATVDTNVND